jgi:succinylglutamate desuccinylase
MKIYIVAAIHGDELFGLKVIGRINRKGQNNVLVRIGNPEAIAKKKRYIDEDLNRSFLSTQNTIEKTIADDIKLEIDAFAPDLVLDFHTSGARVGKIAIVAENTPIIQSIADALGMDAVVIMPKRLTTTSLIGHLPDRSLSLEFGGNERSDKLAQELAEIISDFSTDGLDKAKLPTYEVFTEIDKNYIGLKGIKNLVFNEDLGGYPFLAGPSTYENIGGFLAKKLS